MTCEDIIDASKSDMKVFASGGLKGEPSTNSSFEFVESKF